MNTDPYADFYAAQGRQYDFESARLSRMEGRALTPEGFPVNPPITGKTWAQIQEERAAELAEELEDALNVTSKEPAA